MPNQYVALLTGKGEGCDYTIGCNKNFLIIEAATDKEACEKVAQACMGHSDDLRPTAQLFKVYENITPAVTTVLNQLIEAEKEEEAAEERKKDEAVLAKLQAKLGKR